MAFSITLFFIFFVWLRSHVLWPCIYLLPLSFPFSFQYLYLCLCFCALFSVGIVFAAIHFLRSSSILPPRIFLTFLTPSFFLSFLRLFGTEFSPFLSSFLRPHIIFPSLLPILPYSPPTGPLSLPPFHFSYLSKAPLCLLPYVPSLLPCYSFFFIIFLFLPPSSASSFSASTSFFLTLSPPASHCSPHPPFPGLSFSFLFPTSMSFSSSLLRSPTPRPRHPLSPSSSFSMLSPSLSFLFSLSSSSSSSLWSRLQIIRIRCEGRNDLGVFPLRFFCYLFIDLCLFMYLLAVF